MTSAPSLRRAVRHLAATIRDRATKMRSRRTAHYQLNNASEEHYDQLQYPIGQNPMGTVARLLSLLVHLTLSEPHDHEDLERQDKGYADIRHAPPLGEGGGVFQLPGSLALLLPIASDTR